MLLALSVISHQSHRLGASSYRVFDEQGGSIGRGENNDWVLDDPAAQLSSRHASVRAIGGCFVIEDSSTNGTGLNSREALLPRGQRVPIADGDRLFLGDFEILVQVVEQVREPPAAAPVREDATLFSTPPPEPQVANRSDATIFGETAVSTAGGSRPPARLAEQMPPGNDMAQQFAALGLQPVAEAAALETLVDLLGSMQQGMQQLVRQRAEWKSRLRMSHAGASGLFAERGGSDLMDAVRRAFEDMNRHQSALFAGMQAARAAFPKRPEQQKFDDAFIRGYEEHVRQLEDATITDGR